MPAEMEFTGKEWDAETGLDYFGARYLSASVGRFTSPDPLMASANTSNPQTWNRYAYVLGNPLAFVDVNGEWPFYVHNRIFEYAFNGVLSSAQIKVIQDASWQADFGPGGQTPKNSPRHSMCAPGKGLGDCANAIGDFVEENLERANTLSRGGADVEYLSLRRFGIAAHTLTDMGSSAGKGPDGPLPWNNGRVEGLMHFLGKRSEPAIWLILGQSIRNAIVGFAKAFSKLAAGRDPNRWADRAITDYVNSYYAAPGSAPHGYDCDRVLPQVRVAVHVFYRRAICGGYCGAVPEAICGLGSRTRLSNPRSILGRRSRSAPVCCSESPERRHVRLRVRTFGCAPATGGRAKAKCVISGKERDAETSLDYFGARYMSSVQGRFTSPDAPFVDQSEDDPQSWNLYTYGRNNPLA